MLKAALARMKDEFVNSVLIEGHAYFNKGHVLNIWLSDGLLKARVKGSAGQIYNVHIDLKTWPGNPSQCSCKYHLSCKHAAACLLSLQDRENLNIIKPQVKVEPKEPRISNNPEDLVSADDFVWYSSLDEVSDNDFFAYQLGIIVDGQSVNIVPLVVQFIKKLEGKNLDQVKDQELINLPLTNGKVLQIEFKRLKPLLRLLFYYGFAKDDSSPHLAVKRYQLLLMQEAEAALRITRARWYATEDIIERMKRLRGQVSLPEVEIPLGLKTELRDYQHYGLNWLQFLKNNGFSGVLADDMGLGKTIQTLAHIQYEKEHGFITKASLIIAPTSLVGNWLAEAKRFTPSLKILVFHGALRHDEEFDDYDLVISTYGLIQRDKARFLAYSFYYLILDEAQSIKNARTKTTQIIQQLQGKHRLCLTGTPLENHLGELWSLFHFLMPGLLGDAKQFKQFFRIPIEKQGDLERNAILNGRVKPFMLRRTKNDVMRELPPKTEITRSIELTGKQRDLYEAIRLTMEKKVRDAIMQLGLGKSHILLLDALLKLRQVCCDPRLLSLPEAEMAHGNSAKLDALMELLDLLLAEGRRVLVFSQFTSMLRLIEEALTLKNYKYLKLTGQTQNRQELVNEFQDGDVPIFLISLKAGGTGLNLTRADTVILYDPWWNPAVQDQAAGRSHRIGQENPVFIYKLIAAGTVEEIILQIQEKKRKLFEGVLSNNLGSSFTSLSEEDIAQFFMPLEG